MINISNSTKQACNGDKLTYREYVVLTGTTTQIDVATELYASAYKDTHFIGTFNMKYIKFTTSNDVQYRNKELTLYKEINGEAFKVGNFIVTEIKDNDSNEEVTVTAYDYGLKFAQPYQTELSYGNGNITLKDVLDEICKKVGVELVNTTITNGDFIVDSNQFVNGEVYGDVISSIAYLSGDFATINNDDKLEFIFNNPTNEIIEDYVDLEDKRDTQPITSLSIGSSVVEGQNAVIKDQALIDEYGEHWFIINDVPFAYTLEKREQLKTAIFDKVKGFGYSSFKSEYAFKPYYTLGDLIQFRNKEGQLVSSIILRFTSKYENIILEAPSVTSSTINYEMPETSYDVAKRAEIIANQNTAELNLLAKKVVTLNQVKSGVGSVTLENAHEGELHRLSIKGNISLLFPSSQEGLYGYALAPREGLTPSSTLTPSAPVPKDNKILYPSNELFSRSSNLIIDDVEYKLDFNFLNYINETDCDEFIYEDGKCWVVRRVGIDADGNLYATGQEVIERKKNTLLNIKSNSTIKLKSFDNAVYEVEYLLENQYTDYFSTKVETKAEIDIATNNINLSVSEQFDDVNGEINKNSSDINIMSKQIVLKSTADGKLVKAELNANAENGTGFNVIADNINLEGFTTINEAFVIDKEGNPTIINGNIFVLNSGIISEQDPNKVVVANMRDYEYNTSGVGTKIYCDYINMLNNQNGSRINMDVRNNVPNVYVGNINAGTSSSVQSNGIWSPGYNPPSSESKKKNIELDDGCLQQILDTDICSFNWNFEDDTDQKHIGGIINDLGGNYNIAPKALTHDKDAVDLYSMVGMSWKAIQELYDIIKDKDNKIKELEEKINGIIESN